MHTSRIERKVSKDQRLIDITLVYTNYLTDGYYYTGTLPD